MPPPLLLPVLQELVLEEGCDDNAFAAFIDARQRAGCPIQLVVCPSRRGDGADFEAESDSADDPRLLPRGGGGAYISSQPPPMSLDIRIPGSYPATPSMSRRLRLGRLSETAPISPISSDSSPMLCHPRLPLGRMVLERLRGTQL
jgi:hypothetical protein